HGCHHEQEMTRMGGLFPKMKITALTMLVGVLAISGTPLFSGWYSKDAVVAQTLGFATGFKQHFLLFLLPVLGAGMTTFYMFRMWFMTFTGTPRDPHVYEHAHESPWLMTTPLVILAFFSVTVAWGWPVWDPVESWLEHQIHHAQPQAVMADFGYHHQADVRWDTTVKDTQTGQPGAYVTAWRGHRSAVPDERNVRARSLQFHGLAGGIALGVGILAFAPAAALYYYRLLDPQEAPQQFPAGHDFLVPQWSFDAIHRALLVRPALALASWCRFFDTKVIDGAVDGSARVTVDVSRGTGRFDNGVIDGLVNVIGDACYAAGARLRNVQTGYLRSYVLFLVLAAVG